MYQIYRIEHEKTQIGPFQTNDNFTQELASKAGENPRLKSPCDDGLPLGLIPFSFVFGAPSLASLKEWFFLGASLLENETIVQKLKEKGFVLAEFLVEKENCRMGASEKQVAFDAHGAKEEGLVAYHPLDMLLKESPLVFSVY